MSDDEDSYRNEHEDDAESYIDERAEDAEAMEREEENDPSNYYDDETVAAMEADYQRHLQGLPEPEESDKLKTMRRLLAGLPPLEPLPPLEGDNLEAPF